MKDRFMNKRFKLGTAALLAAGATVAVSAFASSAAVADPSYRTYTAVGSDTIQSLFDGIAYGYNGHASAATNLDSFDAFGSAQITTKASGPSFARPAGSGDGRKALSASWDSANPLWKSVNLQKDYTGNQTVRSVDLSRSSGQPSSSLLVTGTDIGTSIDNLTYVPIARDAVTIALGSSVSGISDITTAQLKDLYSGTSADGVVFPGGTADPSVNGTPVHVELPQSSSGTRQFFLTALFGTATPTLWAGVDTTDKVTTGAAADTLQENNATEVTATGLIPFSAAQYIAQNNAIATDTGVGSLQLPTVDGRPAVSVNSSTGVASASNASNSLYGDTTTPIGAQVSNPTGDAILSRDVYAVVPTANLNGTGTYNTGLKTLVTSTIPGDTTAIHDFGFKTVSFFNTAADYLHSRWEH
jgi:ABC-type phosphate transport system substrate-binding protein